MDLLQGGIIHFCIIWHAYLGGGVHWYDEIPQLKRQWCGQGQGPWSFGVELPDARPEVSGTAGIVVC